MYSLSGFFLPRPRGAYDHTPSYTLQNALLATNYLDSVWFSVGLFAHVVSELIKTAIQVNSGSDQNETWKAHGRSVAENHAPNKMSNKGSPPVSTD